MYYSTVIRKLATFLINEKCYKKFRYSQRSIGRAVAREAKGCGFEPYTGVGEKLISRVFILCQKFLLNKLIPSAVRFILHAVCSFNWSMNYLPSVHQKIVWNFNITDLVKKIVECSRLHYYNKRLHCSVKYETRILMELYFTHTMLYYTNIRVLILQKRATLEQCNSNVLECRIVYSRTVHN